jgi:GDP-4-dehydro-6-deoxy-D-mannose reductase
VKALVTGASGFVGGHLAEHLLAQGDQVLGASRGGAWPDDVPEEVRRQAPIVAWDVGDEDGPSGDAREQFEAFAPDCVYHLAAVSVPGQCGQAEPNAHALAVNVHGTSRVLRLAAGLENRPRVLLISTSHVYRPPSAPEVPLTEDDPVAGRGGYGISKRMAEEVAGEFVERDRLDVIIARSFQHTGPRQAADMMLPEWCAQFCRPGDQPVRVLNRDTTIDLTDVRDVIRAYRLLIEHGDTGVAYNIGSGRPRRTGDVLSLLETLAGGNREIIELRPGVRHDPVADITRITAATGWHPEILMEKTVADTWAYWRRRAEREGNAV